MTETLLDFSSEISDYEYITQNKIVNLVDSLNIEHIFVKDINQNYLQDFVILFPKKTFFFTVTLYGGGTSGMKTSFTSNMATGGFSSGTIVRFPIEINNEGGTYFAKVRIGKGGEGFDISEKILYNNGEYSNFDLVQSNETFPNPYTKEKGRKNVLLIEGLSAYGSGKITDQIIEGTSTNTYFSFNGSNSGNTSVQSIGKEHRNFYAPYTSVYNGYNSFVGIGGDHMDEIDGEENTGAGGAGVDPLFVFANRDRAKRAGKGGNGGCIIEYEGNDKLEIFVENYLYITYGNNTITFIIYDNDSGSRNIEIQFEPGVYHINYLIQYLKEYLNQTVSANVSQNEGILNIKMINAWSVDVNSSSGDLLIDLGIMNSDVYQDKQYKKATIVDGVYQLPFSGQITSVCKLTLFQNNKIFN
jgi:hypothetical protein